MDYKPIVYLIPKVSELKNLVTKNDIDIVLSKAICEPKLEYGFYYFMHQSKEKTRITSEPRYKNKYHITNPFEHIVPEYESNVHKMSDVYFSLKDNGIISRAFYKLWEILMLFDVLPESGTIKTAHLAEAPGGFIQAVALYRQKFYKASEISKDTYHTISLKPKGNKGIPSFKNTMLENIKQLTICDIEDCDIMKMHVQRKLNTETNECHLITADGGFEWKDENYQEQEAYGLILCEILTAFRLQRKDGNFVLKIFDTFTDITIKILALLSTYYENVYVYKPLMSRPTNSEKYVICTNFKGISKKEIDNLEQLIENIIKSGENIVDIFTNYELEDKIKTMAQSMCCTLGNEQYKSINIMISYLYNGVFFGDDYHKFLEEQKKANDFWIETFYPINPSDFKQTRKKLKTYLKDALNQSSETTNKLKQKLIY